MIKPSTWFCCIVSLLNFFLTQEKYQNENWKGLYSRDVMNYEVVVPQRVDKQGNFISNLIPHRYEKRSTKESDFVFYKLPIAGEERIIQLTPNTKFVSPQAIIEIHEKNTMRESDSGEELKNALKNIRLRRLQNSNCHYTGVMIGLDSSKVALSTCFGLAGFIQTKNGTHIIEPAADCDFTVEGKHPHILYRSDDDDHKWPICNIVDSRQNRTIRESNEFAKTLSTSDKFNPLYIETLIVMDKAFLTHYEDLDAENYILTVFNMAFSLFHDASIGLLIKLSLVRMIRLEIDQDELNMNTNQDAVKTLKYFQDWQYRMNPGDDSHPNHHDVAILITRMNAYTNLTYGFLGVSTLGTACDQKQSAIMCKDNGLRLGFVMAHEIAHLLGVEHDGFNNACVGLDDDGFRTVMHPQVLLSTSTWSECTEEYIKTFLESGFGECLLDEPSEHNFNIHNIHELLPGVIYDADYQCKHLLNSAARECNEGSTCDSLNCQIPGHLCVLTKSPPAPGTRCGENMWCRLNKCLRIGERPNAVDGNWGEWSPWGECSRTCGSGISQSERQCDRPIPSRGGKYCSGENKRHRICSLKPCDMAQPSFRDIQCGEFDDWVYPEDGRKHTWKEYFYHDENPCALFCINENLEVVALKPRVIDGTPCYRGIRDTCIDGVCRTIPCDLNLESNAIEDVCGVCHGDGTTCNFVEGQQSIEKFPKAITKLINVPIGTRNIKVEEKLPSAARILVRDKETKDFYIKGNKLGMYSVPGSQVWLGMIRSRQEALTIPGPVTRGLTIWIERIENVTVKWSMALPTTQPRKPEFTWDFIRWSPCSAMCGPGTQKSEPSCVEEIGGLVESSYCSDMDVPPTKVRFCEVGKCKPRWMVADWKDCENISSSKRMKRRVVHCVKMVGDGEGESDILPDEECPPPKPEEEEPCDSRYKRHSLQYLVPGASTKDNVAMFSSNRIKFGSRKKYDEYLKNFNALSSPQRKSETIPLHFLDTPHFMDYYRILKATGVDIHESKSGFDRDETLKEVKKNTQKNPSSLLSFIYKNTLNGKVANFGSRPRRRNKLQSRKGRKRKKIKFVSKKRFKRGKKKDIISERNLHLRESDEIEKVRPEGNHTIRFGEVLIDRDEEEFLEVIFEKGEKVETNLQADQEKLWNIKGPEALQFLQNLSAFGWNNKMFLSENEESNTTMASTTEED